jgi:uncharacterized surface protein with fasciclin (FAS1) repeats
MLKTSTLLAAAAATALLAAPFTTPSFAKEKTVMVGGAAMYPSKNIIQNASKSKDNKTLVAAVKAAGLVDTLEGPGPFTVFAPTDEAFKKLPKGTVETLLKPENKDKLATILKCHVVSGNVTAGDLKDMIKKGGGEAKLDTVGGCPLTAKMMGKHIVIEDGKGHDARITIANVKQSNGEIHVINSVLLPAG